jgi:hypothetical protein
MTGMPSAFVRSQGFPEAGTMAECRLSALAAAAASRELQSWRDGGRRRCNAPAAQEFRHFIEQPMLGTCSVGPFPVRAI